MKESIGIKFAQVVGDGLKVHSGFSIRCYRKTRTKFLVGKDKILGIKREICHVIWVLGVFFFFFFNWGIEQVALPWLWGMRD